ncbi:arsenate reductase (glutaredoxin) [Prolixibacteraceae bacterium JC049]|jgi:arsenate reductase (glutaredoxin)|nr:arsenate reductase (glutaredoxin) [Prolixibacteraceae bacterium JC049]
MIKIYHNPRCSKSRAGLAYLEEKGVEFEKIEYLKDEFSVEELTEVIAKTGKKPFELIRTHEDLYKKEYKGKEFSDEQWIKIMVENPRLIHRPIIVKGDSAVWAQPPQEIDKLL